ncbi:MLX-interacting protein isoform X2 [Toxorhynchites rutilus septentrionalis]|nr:MLX-interacting protein isoform X2 [Toxorhynchites rutilus septentrionalis]
MKRKTLVCQFASPLDVDVHTSPQAILLEGKYWKRKCNVIKAEYKKWRRFYVNRALGATNIIDTASELDFLEWSPNSNEPMFMITDCMPTDTLLSTLSQYPFPDSREIARGAGRADFIQPSLGPLQPNFDDLMDLDLDFLNFPRLAPVPEEGSEDILKAIDYNYSSGSNHINSSSSIQEITDTPSNITQQNSTQSQTSRSRGNTSSVITSPGGSITVGQQQQPSISSIIAPATIHYSAKIFTQNLNATGSLSSATSQATIQQQQQQQQQQQLNNAVGTYLSAQIGPQTVLQQPILTTNLNVTSNVSEQTSSITPVVGPSDESNKDLKPKYSRNFLKYLGREPHNYDKCPPTTHQTMAYNLVTQPHLSQSILNNPYAASPYQVQPGGIIQISGTPPAQNMLNYNLQMPSTNTATNPMNLSSSQITGGSNPNILVQGINSKLLTHSQSLPVANQPNQQKPQPRSNSMPTSQNSPPGAILQQPQQEIFKGSLHPTQTSTYKSYHNHQLQPYKIPSQNTGAYGGNSRNMRNPSPPGHQATALIQQPTLEQSQQQLQDLQLQQQQQPTSQQQQQQQQLQQQQSQQKRLPPHPTKEMFRSNSLPINATFPLPPKEENFVVPRYQAKQNPKLRSRSNSMIMKQPPGNSMATAISGANLLPALHTTTSEPMLNVTNSALLAQLLTTNNTAALLNMKQHSTSSSAINKLSLQKQQQQQQQQSSQHIAHRQQQTQPQQQPLQTFQQHSLGSPISPTSSHLQLSQSAQSPQNQPQAQLPSLSNLPGHNSVLTFASSTPCAGISLSNQSLSAESVLDNDAPMSPIGVGSGTTDSAGSVSSSGGGGSGATSKFIQQQHTRTDNQRRTGHIHAEQKRRYNIKNGFDTLHLLIPQLQQNPNAKLSKAAMLHKGAEYIKQLRSERAATNEKMDALRREIDALNNSLSNLQTALPASGAPVSRQRTGRVQELYHQYVRQRTLDNWKFWIFGLIFEPLMNTFNQTVSVANIDEMCRTSQLWVDQHCSLVELRPAVSNKLRQLSTTTDILSDPPTSLQEEVLKAISTSMPLAGPSGNNSSHGGSNANSPNRNSGGM